jgi:hypothetical protein
MLLLPKLAAIIILSYIFAVLKKWHILKSLPSETTQKNVDKYPSIANVENESCSQ